MQGSAPLENRFVPTTIETTPLRIAWPSARRLWLRLVHKYKPVTWVQRRPSDPWRDCRSALLLVEGLTGFALYMVAAVLVLLLSETRGEAYALRQVSTFNALSNAGPLVGGWLAGRWLSFRWPVMVGALLLCLGFGLWARLPSGPLVLPMGVLVCGSALFRSNIVALFARLTGAQTDQKEHSFRAIYVAFNVGASLAPSAAALLRPRFGWQGPLSASAVTMALAVFLLALVMPRLGHLERARRIVRTSSQPGPEGGKAPDGHRRVHAIGVPLALLVLALLLWGICYGQADGTMMLWARDHTQRVLFGVEIPTASFATLPAILVFALMPLATRLSRWRVTRTVTRKMLVGMLGTACSMAVLALAAYRSGDARSSVSWLLASFVLLGVGEIVVAPLVQLALCSLTEPHRHGIMVAVFYGTLAIGYGLAGRVGASWPTLPKPAFFGSLAMLALLGCIVIASAARWLQPSPTE